MPNLAAALKEEIARLARKELKSDIDALRKSTARYRSEIAALKRQAEELDKKFKGLAKQSKKAQPPQEETDTSNLRFRADGFKTKREKLGLSAEATGRFFNVSGQTIYLWEGKKTTPRPRQMEAIAAFRKLGKKQAHAILAGLGPVGATSDAQA